MKNIGRVGFRVLGFSVRERERERESKAVGFW